MYVYFRVIYICVEMNNAQISRIRNKTSNGFTLEQILATEFYLKFPMFAFAG